jgi:NADPH:quinone reductase-like Zn-dependent oxidoreductase
MKAIEISSFGIDGLEIRDLSKPVPEPGQVLLQVVAFSLNYLDLLVVKGLYNPALPLPHIPGSDACGVVEKVGEGVEEFKPGDEVITHFFTLWQKGPFEKTYFKERF